MRKRWLAGTVAVLALVGGAATSAQRSWRKPPLAKITPPRPCPLPTAMEVAPIAQLAALQDLPGGEVSTGLPAMPADAPLPLPGAPADPTIPAFPPSAEPETAAGVDPLRDVEAFVRRGRKEADDSIVALTREAERLKARLAKVEAALARWQGVSNALAPDADPAVIVSEPGHVLNEPALDPAGNARPDPASSIPAPDSQPSPARIIPAPEVAPAPPAAPGPPTTDPDAIPPAPAAPGPVAPDSNTIPSPDPGPVPPPRSESAG